MPSVSATGLVVQANPPPSAASSSVVVESDETTLPYSSCSSMTTENVLPAWTEVGGAV